MEFIGIKQAAEAWGISLRRVQLLCAQGRIQGAKRIGRAWVIPSDAVRPADERTREVRERARAFPDADKPLPRKTPFLYMSDLYSQTGTADAVTESLSYHHEAQTLFRAEIAYLRGEIDEVYECANYLLGKHSGFYAVLSAGMLLALCAIWRGDVQMWNRAKMHIAEAPARNDNDRDIMSMSLTAVDSVLYHTASFPEWFKVGCFEPLHPDALPAAKVYYAKYLYALGYSVASGEQTMEGVKGLTLMGMLPYALEPMISQAISDRSVVTEIYLRLTSATIYHSCGKDTEAVRHIDRAIELALPDRFYGLLAEYRRVLDQVYVSRLERHGREVAETVDALYKQYSRGWTTLGGAVRQRYIANDLTVREREVAKLAAFGLSNAEIAAALHLSVASVKQTIRAVLNKGGVDSRAELASIL